MKISIYLISIFSLLGFSSSSFCSTLLEGEEQGAFYRIEVPDLWNGDLVVWNHGINSSEPSALDFDDLGPLAAVQLSQGYAVAASSFRMNGWALFKTTRDNENLLRIFINEIGMPNNIFMTGGSMGGLVSEQYLEKGRVGHVAAAYSVCGALAGSKNWDAFIDLRLVYDAVCADVPGAFIPGGPDGLPADSTLSEEELILAVNACTGAAFPPEFRTPEQQERLDKISQAMHIDEISLFENMALALVGISNLVHSPEKLNGRNGLWNYFVDYDDPDINANIQRTFPRPRARFRLFRNYIPRGYIDDAKLLALHTDKDDLVVVENLSFIEKRIPAENLTTAVVVQEKAEHCGFTDAEFIAGWESVRNWVDTGVQPSAQDIQDSCKRLDPAMDSCRIDPFFVVNELKDRIRPRIPYRYR